MNNNFVGSESVNLFPTSVILKTGDKDDLVGAFLTLWKSQKDAETIAQSFVVKLKPGTIMTIEEWVLRVGKSRPDGSNIWVTHVSETTQETQTRWQRLMAMPAANDGKSALAA